MCGESAAFAIGKTWSREDRTTDLAFANLTTGKGKTLPFRKLQPPKKNRGFLALSWQRAFKDNPALRILARRAKLQAVGSMLVQPHS